MRAHALRGGLISIHALHTEGDAQTLELYERARDISIHALHTEGDIM